jgi:hypothetical protein
VGTMHPLSVTSSCFPNLQQQQHQQHQQQST